MKNIVRILILFAVAMSCFDKIAMAGDAHRNNTRAVTMWWVIFNAPENCVGNPGGGAKCSSVDVFGEAFLASMANGAPDPSLIAPNLKAKLGVLFATGGVTDKRGRIQLVSSIYKNAPDVPLKLPPGADPMGFGRGLESEDAEIHLVVRDHGRAIRRDVLPQITNFLDPYCSDPNLLYFAGDNVCADTHFAIFGPAESGSDAVYAFADPMTALPRASATLLRDGDALRAVLNTRLPRR